RKSTRPTVLTGVPRVGPARRHAPRSTGRTSAARRRPGRTPPRMVSKKDASPLPREGPALMSAGYPDSRVATSVSPCRTWSEGSTPSPRDNPMGAVMARMGANGPIRVGGRWRPSGLDDNPQAGTGWSRLTGGSPAREEGHDPRPEVSGPGSAKRALGDDARP